MTAEPQSPAIEPVALAQALIRRPSVTPVDAGALDVLRAALDTIGFECHVMTFSEPGTDDVTNLYARLGTGAPNFCFAGHTDVVPTGATENWDHDPFSGDIIDGSLFGRGAADMKSAIAAFVGAVARFRATHGDPADWPHAGSISLLISGDEEGPAINGTRKVLDWLAARNETIDACVVGEPTNPTELGDMIKIGRRGSLVGTVTVHGVQGHTAYPHLADNPVHRLLNMLQTLTANPLDDGSDQFQPSTLQISTIDVGNPTSNVIPASAMARFNIRFNDHHTSQSLTKWLHEIFSSALGDGTARYELDIHVTGESFLTPPGPLSDLLVAAIEQVTGRTPQLSTTGGTSDARFIKDHCPVAEFGLVGQTMHQANEHVACADIDTLAEIYRVVLEKYFAAA
ncbi:MAG: succinyl-diaminopimelate desuccinylase [Alphaproteobacteria bacterium]|nr:succinyl-diaminopimelate desuccinylase [Alphaproteobacteria bacterium]